MNQAAEALAELVAPPAASPRQAWEREEDAFDLSFALEELRDLVESDWDLVDLQRQAVRAAITKLPKAYVGLVVLSFCERWLELAEPENPARWFVEALLEQLRPLAEDEPEGNVVHDAAEFVRPYRHVFQRPRLRPQLHDKADDRPRRRDGRRESRPGRRRQRVRSGSRGDPPDDADPDELSPEPGPAGPVRVEAAR